MQVEMEHNPYQGSLQILINGHPRNRLSGYANKPFTVWWRDIFALLDGETNEPYSLILTAGNVEARVIKELSRLSRYCKTVDIKSFAMNIPLENRINNLNGISQTIIPVRFCVLSSLQNRITENEFARVLREPLYKNKIWNIQPDFCKTGQLSDNSYDCEYLFILASSKNEINLSLLSSARRGYYSTIVCVVIDEDNHIDILGNNLAFHSKYANWKESIGELLQCTVIGDCFWNIYQDTTEAIKQSDTFEVKERPRILMPSFIELDGEEEIGVYVTVGEPPDIEIAVRNPSLLSVSGHILKGIKPGTTNVQVFEKGTYKLLASSDVEVRFVSKIRELFARDIGLRHGDSLMIEQHESAAIAFDYAPDDAVDVSKIRWSSSNSSIARVHSLSGRVTAMKPGACTIQCNINNGLCNGFSIQVEVIPVPEHVELPDIYRNELVLNEGEIYHFRPVVSPPNAKFEGFSIHIDDSRIASVRDSLTIEAIAEGETTVVIMESPHNTSISITLKVIGVHRTKKSKKGLLSKFFK